MALLGGKTVPPDGASVVPHDAAAFGVHDPEVFCARAFRMRTPFRAPLTL